MGLAALANVAVRAVGTAPGALHSIPSEVPKLAVGRFPYTDLAGFFGPLGVPGHVLAIRSLRQPSDTDRQTRIRHPTRHPAGDHP